MKSSYVNADINYGDILSSIAFTQAPRTVVEIGILDGFSLEKLVQATPPTTKIMAYDIFDEFNGNSADMEELQNKFKNHSRVEINYGDFYNLNNIINGNLDIIHIDIANDGNVYKFAVENYMNLLSRKGIIVLEGGSRERDEVDWMKRYEKPPITEYLKSLTLPHKTLGKFPSITMIKNGE
jgi:predicted O-methyltransferase YrrM